MAARKQLWHPDDVRAKIQASQLCKRLHKHAFGEIDMTPTQVDAAKTLLKKAMPDLASVSGNLNANVTGSVNFTWKRPKSN